MKIVGTDPTGNVVALSAPCTCGATTAYRRPDELACVRCGTDRTPTAAPWRPGLDVNARYAAAALTNPARLR